MVFRIYVEKKKRFEHDAHKLRAEINDLLEIKGLKDLRIVNRYDAENIDEKLFGYAVKTVFSEPQTDDAKYSLDAAGAAAVFAVEYLPGQFDQRADSAAQCIALISRKEKPLVRSAKVYVLYGELSENEVETVKKYVINPVEAREAELKEYATLKTEYDVPRGVETLNGFTALDRAGLEAFVKKYALAMDGDDAEFCRDYFRSERRDPTITEIRMIDTYWSDHCRHTTFLTTIDNAEFEDEEIEAAYNEYLAARKALGRAKPVNLMDIATLAAKQLKKSGRLEKLDESEEINACTVKIKVSVDGEEQNWLLLFKNETHNHPTEIEPFGGAATCIGGAIRDPLSGRSYVYAAMRVTGAGNPLTPVKDTIKGKLPQRKIVTTAAAGYSSYGNQIGLATGLVDEIYHEGYVAKRMEIGAVIAAAPAENVVRKTPEDGDLVILLGGRTGRDGCGGATGSSKSHTEASLTACGAEVQKGNAPEERKIQRLFRNGEVTRLIKRCNDFGAGGVSVAIGELADGLAIELDAVRKKYEGLDGTELAISESQERMAVVVAAEDEEKFIAAAQAENLEAYRVAVVTESPRMVMRWRGQTVADLSRAFLDTNGAVKHARIRVEAGEKQAESACAPRTLRDMAGSLKSASRRGLAERFDSTIGAGTVLMPFGGKNQLTPIQAMVQKISVPSGHTDDCSLMAWGFNPYISEKSRYHGAYLAVVESVCKLVASGASFEDVYLTFQEYFERPNGEKSWGKPLSALLGALKAQTELGIAAIGGKDSMSGTFENIHVPPTLVSFAVTTDKCDNIISNDFKAAGHKVFLLSPEYDENGLPKAESLKKLFARVTKLIRDKKAFSVYTPGMGGVAEAVMKAAFGNGFGFNFDKGLEMDDIFGYNYATFVVETAEDLENALLLGEITADKKFAYRDEEVSFDKLLDIYEQKLESVYSCNIAQQGTDVRNISFNAEKRVSPAIKTAKPKVLIPAFPGTNCEFDSAKAVSDAGGEAEIFVINNLSPEGVQHSVEAFADKISDAQMIFIPGGFSGGDEPDGSGKFITAFFRNAEIKERVAELLDRRDGLMCGICNGFQALIKLGLVPFGKIIDTDEHCPTLTFNTIARHQSRIVRTRIASNMSPWLSSAKVGDIYSVPISHGEGRFIAEPELIKQLEKNGQIATQYVDLDGNATADIHFNPNNSVCAVEGITSPDGRVFGKMGHSERVGFGLYKNVPGDYNIGMFENAVKYFKG